MAFELDSSQKGYSALYRLSQLFDFIIVLLLGYAAIPLRFFYLNHPGAYRLGNYHLVIVLGAIISVMVFSILKIYRQFFNEARLRAYLNLILSWGLAALIFTGFLYATKTGADISRLWMAIWLGLCLSGLVIWRLLFELALNHSSLKKHLERKVLLIGKPRATNHLIKHVASKSFSPYTLLHQETLPADITRYLQDAAIQEVWLIEPLSALASIQDTLHKLEASFVTVRIFPEFHELYPAQPIISHLFGLPTINIQENPLFGFNLWLKNVFDRVFALAILILASPLLLIIALLIKTTSPGPILFKQARYGLDGKPIKVYKFRSMVEHSENAGTVTQAKRDDARVTPIGRFLRRTSLDEFPQFFNVLQGTLSVVGPRPHAIAHNELYRELIPHYMQRHMIKPGITGWAQVNGWRGETDTLEKMQKRLEYDLYYIQHWSFGLDFKIIVLTVLQGLWHRNAY